MDWTQTILSVAWGDPTTKFFTIIIGGILVLSLLSLRIPSPRLQHIEAAAPTLMTTLGVLGTFTGVFLALLEFDVSNIDKSVPALLAGLKVALRSEFSCEAKLIALSP